MKFLIVKIFHIKHLLFREKINTKHSNVHLDFKKIPCFLDSIFNIISICNEFISTEHGSSELRVIQTKVHRVDPYFLHLTLHT